MRGDRAKFEHVPLGATLLYSGTALPLSMVGSTLALYLYAFYVKEVGLNPLLISAAFTLGFLWDAVSDQLMGQISDRTSWKWGRRRPYFLLGILPFGLSFYCIFAPPPALAGAALFAYLLFFRLTLFTGSTMIYVPLYALAPEMAQTYHGRTRLSAYREALSNVGDLVGMLAPLVLVALYKDGVFTAADPVRGAYATVGLLGLGLTIVFVTGGYLGTYEDPTFSAPPSVDWRAGWHVMRQNVAFRRLILATAFPGMAIQIVAGLFLFIITDVLGVSDDAFTAKAFLLYVGAAIASYPLWVRFDAHFGKAAGFRAAILMLAGAYLGVYALAEGTLWRMYPIMAFAGAGNAGFWTAMFSQLADIADFDELETGARREGLFAGFAALVRKVGYAIGGGAIGPGLWAIGYVRGPDAVQTAATLFGLKVVFSVPTCLFALLGLVIFRNYPITEAAHTDVLQQLAARRAAAGDATPTA